MTNSTDPSTAQGSARHPGRTAVTGASSGIGRAFARRLARGGAKVVLVGRDRTRLASAAAEVAGGGGVAEVVATDLAHEQPLRELECELAHADLDLLVNAAGLAGVGSFAELDPDQIELQVRVNVVATMRLTRAVLPRMVARGRGAVINVSSLMPFDDRGGWTPYVATKACVTKLTENLAVELEGTGVGVQALCPGPVSGTDFFATARFDPSVFPAEVVMSADDVVEASLVALERGEVVCVPGLEDPGAVADHRLARLRVLREGRRGTLASRYRSLLVAPAPNAGDENRACSAEPATDRLERGRAARGRASASPSVGRANHPDGVSKIAFGTRSAASRSIGGTTWV